jgi:hypothetical protein
LILTYAIIYINENSNKQNNTTNNKRIRFISAFIFLIFFGFRGYVGSDWFNYEYYYSETTLDSWTIQDYELGFSFFAKLFHDLGLTYHFFIFFITLIQVILWNRFLKTQSNQIALSYIILISLFPLLIIDLLRNLTSILIAIQAIDYINKNRKFKAAIIILLSVLFHTTGVFFFLLFLINRQYFKRSNLIIILILGIIVYILQFNFFNSIVAFIGQHIGGRLQYLASTITDSDKTYGLRFGILEKLFILVLVLMNYNRIVRNKLIKPIYFNGFFCYCFLLLYFSTSDTIINRFSLLFFWAYLMILCNFKILIGNNNMNLIVIFICVLKTFVTFNRDIYEYSNNIITEDSYYERKVIREKAYEDSM